MWKALDVTYARLLSSLAVARSVVNDSERSDVYLKDAGSSCTVLYKCMSTYSTE
ncbi:uncharacterized protein LAESUDRAFT_721335 [Laetiporus sulphureus 93-53]|uniref:Uncharacterized protein n=1 Tax=Laetiporus sulphureus 93-53 TaxID=1314785 RepID=A0A165GWP8_9APHY|nr:uncharacterized protein LAESUDRAFT_721335 [Laetiporus sulphureus 93-53]KZT10930.1 hypothetical protein LAESUDRAFT_721335 [Laetiporus sulphureus 93-53]